jgi:hypothetical protein
VQSWFDCNRAKDSQHNHVGTRELLKEYDPDLAELLTSVFGDVSWRYVLPTLRSEPSHLANLDRRSLGTFAWPEELLRWKRLQAAKEKD